MNSDACADSRIDRHLVLLGRPWADTKVPVEIPIDVVGMIRSHEMSLLYHLARDYYSGEGEIVDGGAFLGQSTKSLALGLRANREVMQKSKRIHSFDKFIADEDYIANVIRQRCNPDFQFASSFRAYYEESIREVRSYVRVHERDFNLVKWIGKPIEILFIDIAKTLSLHQHVILEFFPYLIPGKSIIVHQDYHHPYLPYIHISMEFLSDYFTIVDHKVDDSIVFLATKKVDDSDLRRAANLEFTDEEQLALFDSAISRIPAGMRQHVELAKAVVVRRVHGETAFMNELASLDSKYAAIRDDPHWDLYRSEFPASSGSSEGVSHIGMKLVPENRLAQLQLAEIDLKLVLRKMSAPPFGWIFGLKRNFRRLLERYIETM